MLLNCSKLLVRNKIRIVQCFGERNVTKLNRKVPSQKWDDAKRFKDIPGPFGLPGIGISHLFMPGGRFYNLTLTEFHQILHEKYGDVVFLKALPGRPDIVSCYDPDDIELVFRTEGKWPIRRGLETFDYFRKNYHQDVFKGFSGILMAQGEAWQKLRTITNPVMMKPKTVKSYVRPIDEIACEFVDRIRKIRYPNGEVPSDFFNEINKWSVESTAAIALSTRLGLLGESLDKNSDAQIMINTVHDFTVLIYELEVLPSFWKIYKTPAFKRMMKVLDTLTVITMKYIDNAIKVIESKSNSLDGTRESSVVEKLYKVDRQIAIVMALDMLMAGVDTTSGTLASLIYMLAINPNQQEKLRIEIMEKLPEKDTKLYETDFDRMPYLRACLKEIARVKPVNPVNMRESGQDLVIKGYQIPKGTTFILPNAYLQTSGTHYSKPDKFIPERWLDTCDNVGIASAKETHPFVYLPFGFGSRTCIGKRFAELEIGISISRILRNFRVEWHHGELAYGRKMINIPVGDLMFRFIEL